jgi:hypothetical protein
VKHQRLTFCRRNVDEAQDDETSSRNGKGSVRSSRTAEGMPTKDGVMRRAEEMAMETSEHSRPSERMRTKESMMSRAAEKAREVSETYALWTECRRDRQGSRDGKGTVRNSRAVDRMECQRSEE